MPYYYGIDLTYIILVLPAMIFALIAQARVTGTFQKFSKVPLKRSMTGAEVAERVLRANGIIDVRVERVKGSLTDHFDPRAKVIRLSDAVYDSASVAAAGVAAHESGHAAQYAAGYAPIKLRNAIIPATRFGSVLALPLILLGFFMSFQPLVTTGVFLFGLAVVFQLITLPVEYNASSRAMAALSSQNILERGELESAKKVLSAAALTYVAALAVSLAQMLRLLTLFGGRRRR